MTARRALADLGEEVVVPLAADLSRSLGVRDRAQGVDILGALGSELGLPAVMERIGDPETWVREEAVIAMRRIGSPEAVPALERALEDEDRYVPIYGAEASKRIEG